MSEDKWEYIELCNEAAKAMNGMPTSAPGAIDIPVLCQKQCAEHRGYVYHLIDHDYVLP